MTEEMKPIDVRKNLHISSFSSNARKLYKGILKVSSPTYLKLGWHHKQIKLLLSLFNKIQKVSKDRDHQLSTP